MAKVDKVKSSVIKQGVKKKAADTIEDIENICTNVNHNKVSKVSTVTTKKVTNAKRQRETEEVPAHWKDTLGMF